MPRIRFVVALLVLVVPALVTAQQGNENRASDKPISGASTPGKETFVEYCASCHGQLGKGDGPVAKALKTRPADLTTLAARNKGQFPEMRVLGAINAGPGVAAHGSETMPVWGPIFMDVGHPGGEREAQLKIYNLMEYIKTLQAK